MRQVFCTVLSKYRLYQGMALYKSLIDNAEHFKLYILCVDGDTYHICSKMCLRNVELLKVEDLKNPRLVTIRDERCLTEYCWTLKAFLIEYVLGKRKSGRHVTYLDGDIYFFSDPAVIYKKDINADVMLSEHDYSEAFKRLNIYCGKYNSGFIVFKNVTNAMNALKWWQDECLKWCYSKIKKGKFGDQKYLDYMPEFFKNICSISTKGVNIAPWNEQKYNFCKKEGKVYVGEDRLVCYHFSGFRAVSENRVALTTCSKEFNKIPYLKYINAFKIVMKDIEKIAPDFNASSTEDKIGKDARYYDI